MNELKKSTITTLEIADMMETEHSKIIRKLDGGKDRKGYIQILAEAQMGVTDYFIKSSYVTAQNKEMPCYEVTKLGCDFLANKFNGEKGVLFTARYVKRFHELEHNQTDNTPLDSSIAGNVAELGRVTERIMKRQGSAAYKIAEAFQLECRQFGIQLPEDFVKIPEFEQMTLSCVKEKEQTQ